MMTTNGHLDSVQKNLFDLALNLSKDNSNEVIYSNNQDQSVRLEDHRYSFVSIKDLKTICFDDSVVFTITHHLFLVLPYLTTAKNVKICTYCTSNQTFNYLNDNISSSLTESTIKNVFVKTNSCAAINNIVRIELDLNKDCPIIPLILQDTDANQIETKPVISDKEMNVGFYGYIDSRSVNAIMNLLRNCKYQELDIRINFFIFGNVEDMGLFSNFKEYYQNSKIIFIGDLNLGDLKEYVKNHVDFLLSYGHYALEAATIGVPVAIPTMSKTLIPSNSYVWLSDVNGYVYEWQNCLNNDSKTLKNIWKDVTETSSKKERAEQCYQYVLTNASSDIAVSNLKKLIDQSTLTPEILFSDHDILSFAESYKQFIMKEGEISLDAFKKNKAPAKKSHVSLKNPLKMPITKMSFLHIQQSYGKKIHSIRKIKGRIKVAFFITFKQSFPTRSIFELMMKDDVFDPYIVIAPNISRTLAYQMELMNDAFESYSKEYGSDRVIMAYNPSEDTYLDFKDEFKIIFFSNPYKHYDHPLHNIDHFLNYNVLTAYVNYGFPCLSYWDNVLSLSFYNKVWNVYAETQSHVDYLKKNQAIHARNVVLTGYSKMDKLNLEKKVSMRKVIIISPHHTVFGWNKLNISNFLRYSELFLKLPLLFKEVDFVFRPHPLLFQQLIENKIWTQNDIQQYLNNIESIPNIRYDDSDYYFDSFAESDAMIHDCGSFIAEYLFTKKPCCYMMKSKEETYNSLIPFGQKCMDNYYHAYEEKDILSFVENVVLSGNDPKKNQREDFVNNELAYNYPHASAATISHLKQILRKSN